MGHLHSLIVCSLTLGLVGCSLKAVQPVALPLATMAGSQAQTSPAVRTYGTLDLTIRWPRQSLPGFNAQALPTSTRALFIQVRKDGQAIASRLVTREATEATASVSLVLETANNLGVEIKAYRESQPDPATTVPIAIGTASGINLAPSQATGVKVTLDAQFVPTITGLSTNVGKVGETVTLTGTNFGSGDLPVEVTFGGVPATSVTRKSETALEVLVPAEASTGRVQVKADGIPSSSNSVFWVLESLQLSSSGSSLYPRQRADRAVFLYGASGFVKAMPTWDRLFPEAETDNGTPPTPTWSLSASGVGALTPEADMSNGAYWADFAAGTTYASASVTARLGSVESNALELVSEDLRLKFQPETLILGGKGAYSAPLSTAHVFSDGATISGEVAYYKSSDPSLVSNIGAQFITQDYYTKTVVEAQAASALLPGQIATASLRLDNYVVGPFVGGSNAFADGPASTARFFNLSGLAFDAAGNLFVADTGNRAVRRVTPAGVVTTIASGSALTVYDPSAAGDVSVKGMAVNREGTVAYTFVNHQLMRITSGGAVSVLAGQEATGFTDGTGAAASFNAPSDLVTDSAGNVYVADRNNHAVRKVTPDGMVTTLAGSGERRRLDGAGTGAAFGEVMGLAVDADDTLYVLDRMAGYAIRKVTPQGQVTTPIPVLTGVASSILGIDARLVCDEGGNLFMTDASGVFRVYANGEFVLVAGGQLTTSTETKYHGIGRDVFFSAPRLAFRQGVGYVADALSRIRRLE